MLRGMKIIQWRWKVDELQHQLIPDNEAFWKKVNNANSHVKHSLIHSFTLAGSSCIMITKSLQSQYNMSA